MRTLTLISLFLISLSTWGQSILTERNRFLTYRQNENWLMKVKTFEKTNQWTEIRQRFMLKENCNSPFDSIQYSPLLVVNGVPFYIPASLTEEDSGKILRLLNEDSVNQIAIIDNLSEEWLFCKPFAGVILLVVNEKTGKRLAKLRLR